MNAISWSDHRRAYTVGVLRLRFPTLNLFGSWFTRLAPLGKSDHVVVLLELQDDKHRIGEQSCGDQYPLPHHQKPESPRVSTNLLCLLCGSNGAPTIEGSPLFQIFCRNSHCEFENRCGVWLSHLKTAGNASPEEKYKSSINGVVDTLVRLSGHLRILWVRGCIGVSATFAVSWKYPSENTFRH